MSAKWPICAVVAAPRGRYAAGNREGGLATPGTGDDYLVYRGVVDPRFVIVPHDLDTLLGIGEGGFQANVSIFAGYQNIAGLSRLLNHPDTVPIYLGSFWICSARCLRPRTSIALIDQTMGGWMAAGTIQTAKNNAAARRAFVESVIPTTLDRRHGPAGAWRFPRTTDGTDVQTFRHVARRQNAERHGQRYAGGLERPHGQWSLASMPLHPGDESAVCPGMGRSGRRRQSGRRAVYRRLERKPGRWHWPSLYDSRAVRRQRGSTW